MEQVIGKPINFALIGASGYIAPKHMKAIKDTGNKVVVAVDPNDSVGILDSYFPDSLFFTEIERFDRHVEKLRRKAEGDALQYMSICSPNYLHDSHVRLALRTHCHAICEKPLTITPWNIDLLEDLEEEYGKKVFTVLQLRLLPKLQELKKNLSQTKPRGKHQVDLSYMTRRGPWYHISWKGDASKSGGVAMNIGIHFFDLLLWLFGPAERMELHLSKADKMAGFLELENAQVKWFLSVDKDDLPEGHLAQGKSAYRSLTIDGEQVEFSDGFTDLHTLVYKDILSGGGFGLAESKKAIELVHKMRHLDVTTQKENFHSYLKR